MLMVMLAEEIFAVVVAIRGSDHRVDVLAIGCASRQEVSHSHWALMIKLDEKDRAVDTVIEDSLIIGGADPGEVGTAYMLIDFLHLNLSMVRMHMVDITGN